MSKRQTRRPFCNREMMEEFKAMKRRELVRQNKSIPLTLLPSEPDELSLRNDNLHDQQQLPFDTEESID